MLDDLLDDWWAGRPAPFDGIRVVGAPLVAGQSRGQGLPHPQPGPVPVAGRRPGRRGRARCWRPAATPSHAARCCSCRTARRWPGPIRSTLARHGRPAHAGRRAVLRPGHRRRRAGRAGRRGVRRLRGAADAARRAAGHRRAGRARARGSRTTSASRRASAARTSPGGPPARRGGSGAEILTAQEATSVRRRGPVPGGDARRRDGAVAATRCWWPPACRCGGWRRPAAERLTGAGVYYGAALTEAANYRGEQVVVVGGANSAGQAAMFFSRYAEQVTMLVRGQPRSPTACRTT